MDTPVPQSPFARSPQPLPAEVAALREVHRAITQLRRGRPVVLAGAERWLLLAAETADGHSLARVARLEIGAPLLLVGEGRAEGLSQVRAAFNSKAQAFLLPRGELSADLIHRLADPTLDQISAPLISTAAPPDAEAAIALVKLTRLLPAVLAAPLGSGGVAEAAALDLAGVAAASVISYPSAAASHLVRVAEAAVPLDFAPNSRIIAFRTPETGVEHLAILVGEPEADAPDLTPPLVRIHSECFTGDLLGSLRCDCGAQLRGAIRRMGDEGRGVLLYLAQEGRGIGLVNKLRAYALQDRGLDTLDANRALGWGADERNFMVAATMLREIGVPKVRLLTNNPDKIKALAACGIEIAGREPHSFAPNGVNDEYLATKASRFGHLFNLS